MVATVATAPHLIMTYCALLALAVLRDDYALLDRAALKRMVSACQDADGGCVFAYFLISQPVTDDEHSGRVQPDSRRCLGRTMRICA
jgi:prenyltransferase beta subunit